MPLRRCLLPAVILLLACHASAQDLTPVSPAANVPVGDIPGIVRQIDAHNIEHTIRTLVAFGARNTLSTQTDPKRGIGAARDWIAAQFRAISAQSGGRLAVTLQSFTQPAVARIPTPTILTNVVALLPGTQPNPNQRVVVISGHYDSMCTDPTDAVHDAPGADDDASGVAVALELARVMSKYRFSAPIIFMAVAGEEQGLLGSTYFAEQAKRQGWRIQAMFTNDIVGSSHGSQGEYDDHTVRVFSEGVPTAETVQETTLRRSIGGENDGPSRQLARFIKEMGERYVHGMKVNLVYRRDRYLRGGDHIPFLERGYPAVRFTEPIEDYHHQHQDVRIENDLQYGDLPEYVDFRYTAQVARVNAAALAALALAPETPHAAGIVTRRLTNDTELQWAANTEPDVAGYEVVWRATTEPYWTHRQSVGNVTTYTFKGLSKDNYCFGVRAIDRQGHLSPVAFPRPIR